VIYTSYGNYTPSVAFTYDPYFPRLTSMTDGTGTTNYSYVPIGTNGALQLASENGPFNNDSIGYAYDALGRMSARNIPGGNEGFTYDAISRLQYHSTGLGTFTYGYLGQTDQVSSRSVTNGGTNISTGWTYDTNTNDRRLTKINNSGVTRTYTLSYRIPGGGGANNPYDVLSIADQPAAGHPFGGDTHTITYDLSDRLLSYGTTPVDYGFAGLLLHPASGLNLGTYRALDGVAPGALPLTLTGRFINRDPAGFGGGINLYDYTSSDPINEIDPLGLCGGSGKGRGKGERRWTAKPSKAAKGAQPVRDKNGKIVGWSIPSPDGKRTPKTLAWGLANGLDPKNFQTATEVGILGVIGGYVIYTAPEWAPYIFGSLAFF